MPVLNKKTLENELKDIVQKAGYINANFLLGFLKAYSKHVDKSIKSYDVAYSSTNHYVKSVEIKYKNNEIKEIDLRP